MTKVITTRHIRHDWLTWNDTQDQRSIKTLCNVKSRPGLCGIPGVTEQKPRVYKDGKFVWGWCNTCVRCAAHKLKFLPEGSAPKEIISLYRAARSAIREQYLVHLVSARQRLAKGAHSTEYVENLIDDVGRW
jgi:hypothetical protein